MSRFKSGGGVSVADDIGEVKHWSQYPTQNFYHTTFPGAELPFGGSGWLHGFSDGTQWHNVRSTAALGFGTQVGLSADTFKDSIACLNTIWLNDQTATATVVTTNRISSTDSAGGVIEEVELLLRFAIIQGNAIGYECTISVDPNALHGQYVQLNRWNGASGSFTLLASAASGAVNNGSVIVAAIVGTTVTIKIDGITKITYDTSGDTPKYASGAPGVGFYYINSAPVGTYKPSDYGFSDFSVSAA